MGNVNQGYNDRVRYTLSNINLGDKIIVEPEGWNTDGKEIDRHKDYGGLFPQFSNSLKFVGDGKDYINTVRDIYGPNSEIRLSREERNPVSDIWGLTYRGFLDLYTREFEDDKVSIKFNAGGLEASLKARDSDPFEIDRIKTVGGIPIDELNPIQIQLDGRNINLISDFIIKPEANDTLLQNESNGNTRGSSTPVPFFLQSNSHENAQSPIQGNVVQDNSWNKDGPSETGNMFFANSDKIRSFRLSFKVDFTVEIRNFDDVTNFVFRCRLGHYKDGIDYILKQNYPLFESESYGGLNNKRFSVSFDQIMTLDPGDSLSLTFDQNYDGRDLYSSHLDIACISIEGTLKINEDSFYDKSTSKGILLFEMFDRLTTICTDKKNAFRSNLLGRTDLGYSSDGPASLLALSHGFWIRQFDKLPLPTEEPKVENLFKPLTTSFKETYDSLDAIWNIGLGIETEGNKEYVILEEKKHFYNRNVLIRLPNQIKKVKRTESTTNYFGSLEFGYEKGGDYQEAMGLDEYNAKSNFTTVIQYKNTYSKVSKHRADSYGQEFARRKSIATNATEDTSYDTDVWFNHLKRGFDNVFLQRKWQDDFAKAPTGTFSPETATNLTLSPVNNLLRHAWWFDSAFKWYQGDFVRYSSSTQNSRLKTQLIGKLEYAENGDILNSELENPRFEPEEVEFDHICDFSVMQQINGFTIVLGKKVMNVYGLIEYLNEFNKYERGFLLNLKPNDNKFRVLKFNN